MLEGADLDEALEHVVGVLVGDDVWELAVEGFDDVVDLLRFHVLQDLLKLLGPAVGADVLFQLFSLVGIPILYSVIRVF